MQNYNYYVLKNNIFCKTSIMERTKFVICSTHSKLKHKIRHKKRRKFMVRHNQITVNLKKNSNFFMANRNK